MYSSAIANMLPSIITTIIPAITMNRTPGKLTIRYSAPAKNSIMRITIAKNTPTVSSVLILLFLQLVVACCMNLESGILRIIHLRLLQVLS